ncbi:sensor histidine kinase [Streptomyces sp. NBC_00286]|uniref:sensor histidine kinase n=1 Tax=Streptomyces sp. NBC_00286 TaxID=2975701 RepID=UPI002E2C0280|nr:nitrate- and nitrite sensing domain-containing protein [Streptomyces sp. NBC_00286]
MPSVTLVALWATTSVQLYTEWQQQRQRNEASTEAARPIMAAFFSLQEERRLSGAALGDSRSYKAELQKQRGRTDAAVKTVQALPGSGWDAPDDIRRNVVQVGKDLDKLADYRTAVDRRAASQQQTFDDYTGLIATDLKLFTVLSNVGIADIDYLARPAIDSVWGMEMISRESAIITRGTVTGRLSAGERGQLAEWIGSERFIYDNKVTALLPSDQATRYRKLMAGSAWKAKTDAEQDVLRGSSSGSNAFSAELGKTWSRSVGQVMGPLQGLNGDYSATLTAATDRELDSMVTKLVLTSAMGAGAVVVVIVVSALLTRMLRRRIFALRQAALDLQTRMPDVVERMRRGEAVDADAELPPIQHGHDELGQLGQALNLARHSALDTTMAQVGQFRGFEKLLQRIARRTQLLIGLQMKKLSELERRHEDPEVLEGLFDLDHLTARLRRYEENLVILGGGQPQRRWRKPVLLLDVLRSAQSEVQDYRRIQIEVEGRVWLSERAVGLVVHVLAELMENAVTFSRPPTPVEVYAARVGRGLAVEIEDRGVGMDPEQYDEANRLMADPPRLDVLSRADDVRLGLYVVSRLAQSLGIKVELRPSSFGGTRVVALIPDHFVVEDPADAEGFGGPEPVPATVAAPGWPTPDPVTTAEPGPAHGTTPVINVFTPLSRAGAGSAVHHGDASAGWQPHHVVPPVHHDPTAQPLPKRVRMASLADELRDPDANVRAHPAGAQAPDRPAAPARSGATIGAFQRQSRLARGDAHHTGAVFSSAGAHGGADPGAVERGTGERDRTEALPYRRRTPTED